MNPTRTVELFLQEGRAARRLAAEKFPADQVPKVGEKLLLDGRTFLVKHIEHLVLRHGKRKATPGVVLTVDDVDALRW